MPLNGWRRASARSGRLRRRRRSQLRLTLLISLLIHVEVGVLLLVTIRRQERPELLPPPSAVTMLFESGRKQGPTLPNPSLQAKPATPPAPESPPVQQIPIPVPPPPPISRPPAPTPPTPSPSPPATSPQTSPPTPPITVPPPTPSDEQAMVPPLPAPPLISPPSPPMPPPLRTPPKQPTPPKPSDFPAPMNFSFGKPLSVSPLSPRPQRTPHIPGTIDMSLGPATKGTADVTPFSNQDEEAEGADWRNALSRWVAEHAYYPEQASRNGEEGDAVVHVTVEPNGRVKEVELVGKSGSMWLDLALLALFRDQHIPPLPYGTKEPIDFNFTMHYVLIRPR